MLELDLVLVRRKPNRYSNVNISTIPTLPRKLSMSDSQKASNAFFAREIHIRALQMVAATMATFEIRLLSPEELLAMTLALATKLPLHCLLTTVLAASFRIDGCSIMGNIFVGKRYAKWKSGKEGRYSLKNRPQKRGNEIWLKLGSPPHLKQVACIASIGAVTDLNLSGILWNKSLGSLYNFEYKG